jgi:hypothetical protein
MLHAADGAALFDRAAIRLRLLANSNMMNKVLDQLDKMPVDFWLLLIAIPILVVACILLFVAKKHRYKNFDRDGELFAPIRIDVGLDSSDAGNGLFGILGDDVSHH